MARQPMSTVTRVIHPQQQCRPRTTDLAQQYKKARYGNIPGFFSSGDNYLGRRLWFGFSRLQPAAPLDGLAGQFTKVFPVQRSKAAQV